MAPDHLDISLGQLLNIRVPGTYLVKVEGDSMEGAGIFCGDLLVVAKGIDAKAGQVRSGQVIICVVNQQPLVKYLAFVGSDPVLRSANRKYPDRFIMEGDYFDIWAWSHTQHSAPFQEPATRVNSLRLKKCCRA